MNPMSTTFKNVRLTDWRRYDRSDQLCRTRVGQSTLKRVTDAMNEGHTVSMRTHYDDEGRELMDAEIVYDGH